MQKRIYGAYGSNMNLEQMAHRCPKAKVIGKGILEDYKLTFRGRYRGVANIQPWKERNVPLVLWEITEECEAALDVYEGYPSLYVKKEVEITVENEKVKAMVYIMADRYTDMAAEPTEYYYNAIKTGYQNNEVNTKPLKVALEECLKELR